MVYTVKGSWPVSNLTGWVKKIKAPNGDTYSHIKMEKLTPVDDKNCVWR